MGRICAIAYIEHGACRLVSRKGYTFKSWPAHCDRLAALPMESAILDGEVVCLDEHGKADFNSLLFRRGDPLLYASDLFWHNDHDLRWQTLIERKDAVRRLLTGCSNEVRYVEHFDGDQGGTFFEVCCAHDLEEIVAKRRDVTYLDCDQETAWMKIKNGKYTGAIDRHEFFQKPRID